MVPLNDWEDMLSGAMPDGAFTQDPDCVRERVNVALSRFKTAVELLVSQQIKRDQARKRLLKAVSALSEEMQNPDTKSMLNNLRFFPTALDLLGEAIPDNLGDIPHEGALEEDLRGLEAALRNRVYPPESEGIKDDSPPPFHALIGRLKEVHAEAIDPAALSFEQFVRAVLNAAEVRPANGAAFADTAFRDALKAYRRAAKT